MLEIKGLTVAYDKKQVLHDVSLEVRPGEILAVVGESGSGKSTMLRTILGLTGKNAVVERGQILFDGRDLLNAPEKELRKIRGGGIAMAFQQPVQSFDPVTKIGQQVYETVRAHEKLSKADTYSKMRTMLTDMHLPEPDRILNSYPFELSGGMCQRVALALAMILKPKLLLADEPTSALDVTVQAQVMGTMMKLREVFGMSILLVTHNIGVAAHMAGRMAVMYGGRIVEQGDTEKILNHPEHAYSKRLIASVPVIRTGDNCEGVPEADQV